MSTSRSCSADACDDAETLPETLEAIASFYDPLKAGVQGNEGYRKSTDLHKLARCARELFARGALDRACTVFLDLGCADGRVNVLMSYFVRISAGVEIDPDILAEFGPRQRELRALLAGRGLPGPPGRIAVMAGSSLDADLDGRLTARCGVRFGDVDVFYTYITLHDVFAERIVAEAKPGAHYLVYGFSRVLPRYAGLELVDPDLAGQGIVALYRKPRPRSP